MMSEPIIGFRDADAWERRGNYIVARARNMSYIEKLRAGLPIEYFLDLDEAKSDTKEEKTLDIHGTPNKVGQLKSTRPDFMEPMPNIWDDLVPSKATWDIDPVDHDDLFKYIEGLSTTRNHRGPARFRGRRNKTSKHEPKNQKTPGHSGRDKTSKHEPKAQKIPAHLGRGQVRVDSDDIEYTKYETKWTEDCEFIINNKIWWELRCPQSYSCGCKYTYRDYDSIIRRFRAQLDPILHPTYEKIIAVWENTKTTILADYKPINLTITIPQPRYFNGIFYEDLDEDDWDWLDDRPLRIYL